MNQTNAQLSKFLNNGFPTESHLREYWAQNSWSCVNVMINNVKMETIPDYIFYYFVDYKIHWKLKIKCVKSDVSRSIC